MKAPRLALTILMLLISVSSPISLTVPSSNPAFGLDLSNHSRIMRPDGKDSESGEWDDDDYTLINESVVAYNSGDGDRIRPRNTDDYEEVRYTLTDPSNASNFVGDVVRVRAWIYGYRLNTQDPLTIRVYLDGNPWSAKYTTLNPNSEWHSFTWTCSLDIDDFGDFSIGIETGNITMNSNYLIDTVYVELISEVLIEDSDGSFHGETKGDVLTMSGNLCFVGDVNGDGYDDFAAGSGSRDADGDSYLSDGEVYIVPGGTSWSQGNNIGTAAFRKYWGDESFAGSLRVHGRIGDTTGDSKDDIFLSATGHDDPPSLDVGGVYLLQGGTSGFETALSLPAPLVGSTHGDQYGSSCKGIGDVNNDDDPDVAICTAWHNNTRGRVSIHFGPFSPTVDVNLDGTYIGDFLGGGASADADGISSGGDVNNDGYDDFLIAGGDKVYLILGKSSWTSGAITTYSSASFSLSGSKSIHIIGDVNGDDYDDILIASYDYNHGGGLGKAWLIYGGSSASSWGTSINLNNLHGSSTPKAASFIGEYSYLGTSASTAGDFNGDGYADFLLGAYGENPSDAYGMVYLFLGGSNKWGVNRPSSEADAFFSGGYVGDDLRFVDGGGDLNNDGFDDLIIGARGWRGPHTADTYQKGLVLVYLGSDD